MVVVVADAAHQGGVAAGEDGVALVLSVGAKQVEAHEVALPHLVGVGQQGCCGDVQAKSIMASTTIMAKGAEHGFLIIVQR